MTYIAGFVIPVTPENKQAYRQVAEDTLHLFKEFGATRQVETWQDDVSAGKVTDYYRAVDAVEGEAMVFSWIEYPNQAVAQKANEQIMVDPRMDAYADKMPFDGARMIYGGFEVIFEDGAAGGATYVDGALLPVKVADKAAYTKLAATMSPMFREHGALRIVEAWGADIAAGTRTDFNRAVALKPDEAVVFSFIEWPDKAVRDAAWGAMFADPRMSAGEGLMDESRRVFGGFVPIVDA